MGDEVLIPNGKRGGILLPLALLALLGGIFFRAGEIVTAQRFQASEWGKMREELGTKLRQVDSLANEIEKLSGRHDEFAKGMTEFVRTSLERQANADANIQAIRDALAEAKKETRLLRDYTEGRISGLPYRPPTKASDQPREQ